MPKHAITAIASFYGMKERTVAVDGFSKHLVVVSGTGFGEGGEGFARLSYAAGEDIVREGVQRIGEFVAGLGK